MQENIKSNQLERIAFIILWQPYHNMIFFENPQNLAEKSLANITVLLKMFCVTEKKWLKP